MFIHVAEAKYVKNFEVEVVFNDGKSGIADLTPALYGPIFEPLKHNDMFAKLHVDRELETIVWPNGADLAPEYIYYLTFQSHHELQEQFQEWGYISKAIGCDEERSASIANNAPDAKIDD
ncbi:MAG: DUF2442 domain-containing protein [Candidatus Methylumidiphilus sp.]|nr:DUF2442 domain-containing protein [Pseudomonadota bacterium]